MKQPDLGLFDDPEINGRADRHDVCSDARRAQSEGATRVGASVNLWHEVPQARFLSWSPAMQFAYCAARDEDSALHASTPEEARWFLERSKTYKEMMHAAMG